MKDLYQPAVVHELHSRFGELRPDSQPRWGKMTAAQMAAHAALTMEYALGQFTLKRHPLGRIFGKRALRSMIVNGKPMQRHAPTHPTVLVRNDRRLEPERDRLLRAIDRFASGPSACTKSPHFFFGDMTPEQWAQFSYVHLDHHLQQFGV